MTDLKSFLSGSLVRLQSWLQFAELKNTVLITANSGLILSDLLKGIQEKDGLPFWVLIICPLLSFTAILFSMSAVLPRRRMKERAIASDDQRGLVWLSVIYYEHIAQFPSPDEYLKCIVMKHDAAPNIMDEKLALDYADQIHKLSRIISFKMRMAVRSVLLTMVSLVLLFVLMEITRAGKC